MPDESKGKKPKTLAQLLSEGLIIKGDSSDLNIERIPTGIVALDHLLGGGLPMGKCVEFVGPEENGKTLTAQYCVAAVQRSRNPDVLFMDLENSYDKEWWQQSGVDTEKLMVSTPTTAEEAIDIMRSVVLGCPTLGMIFVDSLAAMIPQPEMDENKSSTDNRQPGLQAKVITFMYHRLFGILKRRVILLVTNQMRDSMDGWDELGSLPGGRAQRHYNHIIFKMRRESWINDPVDTKRHIGFNMEITNRKNKTAKVANGEFITLPLLFGTQIDWTTKFIQDGLEQGFITRRGPYYYFGDSAPQMGMQNLRNFFTENPEQLELLKTNVGA